MAKVLMMEDDPAQQEIYQTLLYYNGFEVVVAEDGRTGLSLVLEHNPDFILIDVMLPIVNGLLAAQAITSNPATAHIPVVLMSAHDVTHQMVLESGARDMLQKPVTGDMLVRVIRSYIGWDEARTEQTAN
jgi:DNA-binding response OmpR family regulator